MNGRTRKKLYKKIAKHDGEYCRCCGALASERPLVLDHKDNDNSNNDENNLQLLCRPCNYIKNPRRPVDECVRDEDAPDMSEIKVNRKKEPQFRNFVWHKRNERRIVAWKELKFSGAEHVGMSPITTERYLEKMCSNTGSLKKIQHGKNFFVSMKGELKF